MINLVLLVIILVSVLVFAGIVTFVVFYLVQMRQSDRLGYREIHEYIAENRKDIAELKRRNRLSEADEPGN